MLAIIIPYYKRTFFEETLESLANQTNKLFKVYIGDDASPENPKDLLEKFKGNFDFVYHRFVDNLGGKSLTQQWERCIALSGDEEWIMILGDDDVLDSTVVASWYVHFNTFCGQTNVIRYATKVKDDSLGIVSYVYHHPIWENAADSYWKKYKDWSRSSLSEYVFSRSVFLKYGFKNYPLAWHSDDAAWLDFSDYKPIYTINESVVYIRMSSINISGKTDNLNFKQKSFFLFLKYILFKKASLFNRVQLNDFTRKYENEILKDRKLLPIEWFFVLYWTVRYLGCYNIKKLVKRIVKTVLNRNEQSINF